MNHQEMILTSPLEFLHLSNGGWLMKRLSKRKLSIKACKNHPAHLQPMTQLLAEAHAVHGTTVRAARKPRPVPVSVLSHILVMQLPESNSSFTGICVVLHGKTGSGCQSQCLLHVSPKSLVHPLQYHVSFSSRRSHRQEFRKAQMSA